MPVINSSIYAETKQIYHPNKVHFLSFDIGLLTAGDVYSLTARIVQTLGEAVEHVTLLCSQRAKGTFVEMVVC